MTNEELKQILPLRKEIAQLRKEMRAVLPRNYPQVLEQKDLFVECLIEMTDETVWKLRQLRRCTQEYRRLLLFLEQISDSHIRQILRYRFYNGWTWRKVAQEVGGGNTEECVRKTAYRFLNNTEKSKGT